MSPISIHINLIISFNLTKLQQEQFLMAGVSPRVKQNFAPQSEPTNIDSLWWLQGWEVVDGGAMHSHCRVYPVAPLSQKCPKYGPIMAKTWSSHGLSNWFFLNLN